MTYRIKFPETPKPKKKRFGKKPGRRRKKPRPKKRPRPKRPLNFPQWVALFLLINVVLNAGCAVALNMAGVQEYEDITERFNLPFEARQLESLFNVYAPVMMIVFAGALLWVLVEREELVRYMKDAQRAKAENRPLMRFVFLPLWMVLIVPVGQTIAFLWMVVVAVFKALWWILEKWSSSRPPRSWEHHRSAPCHSCGELVADLCRRCHRAASANSCTSCSQHVDECDCAAVAVFCSMCGG